MMAVAELQCPKCLELNLPNRAPMVEIVGAQIVCAMCGKASPAQKGRA